MSPMTSNDLVASSPQPINPNDSVVPPRQRSGGDSAPGEQRMDGVDVWSSVRIYLIGFVLAAALTAGSFWISSTGLIYGPGVPVALLVFALAQIGVHLVFFLHLTTAPDNVNNAMALAFGVLVMVLLIGGTLWITTHMNANMMPIGVSRGPHMHVGHP